jgi:SAM-dependent methyltransferase
MDDVSLQYRVGGLLDSILAALAAAGKDIDGLDPDDLTPLEEFHALGRRGTAALADAAGLAADEKVLDVGCGIGGPARFLTRRRGCRVTGIDLTPEFVEVARELCARTGVDVRIERADALSLPFADASFDVVWTQHVSMNIADKPAFYRELRRVARPGGRLAFFDAVAGDVQPLVFPVPWADVPGRSFLEPQEQVRGLVEAAGFAVESWRDESEAAIESFLSAPSPGGSSLALVVPNLREKAANYLQNLREDRVRVIRCIATAAEPR